MFPTLACVIFDPIPITGTPGCGVALECGPGVQLSADRGVWGVGSVGKGAGDMESKVTAVGSLPVWKPCDKLQQ